MNSTIQKEYDSTFTKLSVADRKLWLESANSTFNKLTAAGKDETVAATQAITKANALFSFGQLVVPAGALMFEHNDVAVQFVKEEEGKDPAPKLEMVGYSGGIIKDHWWWDDLAIDLDGIQFSSDKFPILENHDTDRKIAFTGKPVVDENGLRANPDTTVFLDNELSAEFVENSKKGFPYQSSVYVQPTSIERVEKDQEVEVNGFTLKGPGTVFRKCQFKEMSVCVFGWDSNTNATAFNQDVLLGEGCVVGNKYSEQVSDDNHSSPNSNINTEEVTMDVTKFKSEYPEIYAEVFSLGKAEEKAATEQKLSEQKDAFEEKFAALNESILQFEKKELIRAEKEMQVEAAALVSAKLAKSDVPEHLHDKVRKLVSYTKFVGEDGVLDKTAFAEAVDVEITSWVDAGVSQAIMGSSFSSDTTEDAKTKLQEEIDSSVDSLLGLV